MQITESSFQNADRQHIHTIKWLPDSEPKAVILLLHGIGEHSGRYRHVAECLTSHGYAVYALDHRGHGKSEGLRTHFDSLDQPVSDLKQYFDIVRAANPRKKIYLYGHSMGSLISMLFLLKYQDGVAGWITSGTPVNIYEIVSRPLYYFGKLTYRIVPKLRLARGDSSVLTRDAEMVAAVEADTLVDHLPTRVGIGAHIVLTGQKARSQLSTLHLPILIMHGGDDALCPCSGSQYIYDYAGAADKTLKIYKGMLHEIHNEIGREEVLQDIVNWLNQHQEVT